MHIKIMKNANKTSLILFSLVGIPLILYIANAYLEMKKYGVYTIARATKMEVAEQGSDLYLNVYYGHKWYATQIDGGYGIEIDSFYFVKILSANPKVVDGIFTKVPRCISIKSIPEKGWATIPTCK